MAKMNYSYKTRRNDTLTNRMIAVFVLMCAAVYALLSIKNWLGSMDSVPYLEGYMKAAPFFPVLPLILFALSLFFFFQKRKAGVDESLKLFSSSFILAVTAVLLVVSILISNFVSKGYVPSIAFVVLVSLLYFIAISFPGPYFVMTLYNALSAFSLYAVNLIYPIDHKIQDITARTILIIVSVFVLIAFIIAKKNGGKFCGIKLMKENASYLPIILAIILFTIFAILDSLSIGSFVIYGIIIGLETIIFALFYAIKMLK